MKVIDKAEKSVYIFNCPACGSKLEANCDDLTIISNKACKKPRYISWAALKCKIRYVGDTD